MSSDAKEKARALLASVKEYPSGYRSYADTETHVRPLTKLESDLMDALKAVLEDEDAEASWGYRAAEVSGDRIETWGPKGDPDRSWSTLAEAQQAAALDDAFVVRRRAAAPWERVHSVV